MKIIRKSKPIESLEKGDIVVLNGKVKLMVDAQVLLIDHKETKEMAIECFNPENEREYQIRYFTGRLDVSEPELYELQGEILYVKREDAETVAW
jgi:hypothetical protein